MPSTRELRQRIRSVKNTAKITKAMQMVASSKMRRAQERVQQARPYADQIHDLVARLANVASNGNDDLSDLTLLKERPVRNIGIVLISPDRGLSGALPSNINRHAASTALEEKRRLSSEQGRDPGVEFIAVGRKGRDFILRSGENMVAEFTNYMDRPSMNDATAIAQVAVDAFLKGEVDVVYLVYAQFVNMVTQKPVTVQLLPVQPPTQEEEEATEEEKHSTEYIYEPDAGEIFKALLPRYVDVQVYQALLEVVACHWSAQMIAMKNATDNADALVQDLSLTYNKVRQAAITTQILEVVAGAGAL